MFDRTRRVSGIAALCVVAASAVPAAAHADNKRLNDSVISGVYTIQHQAGCTNDVSMNNSLYLAAQWHADDMINNRNINDDIGSDGSTPQDRANAAGFHGKVTETVAINPALSISSLELIRQWYYNPDYLAIMRDCANTAMGVWSNNSLDRTVVVALYGQPAR
ncbi:CAP domain-containing protein [Mycobacterium kubicae]|nr:CAP domain-containing protein [Mycobacterium kubicae]QNI07684.1 CAP domain-containing protein [Mycobacterium kubicae]